MNEEVNVLCNLSASGPAECRYRKYGCCTTEFFSTCEYKGDTITTYTFDLTVQINPKSGESRTDLLNRLYDFIHGLSGIEDHSIS